MSKLSPSKCATYQVAKELHERRIISNSTFRSFKREFIPIVNNLQDLKEQKDKSVFWDYVRGLFDFDDEDDCIPVNAANLCPSFHSTQLFVNNLELDMNRDVSIQKRTSVFSYIIDHARESIAAQLNIGNDEIAFMRNATEANNIINNGLDFKEGEEVVIWKENHGTNNRAWKIRKRRFPNFKLVEVDTTGATTEAALVQRFMDNVNENTRLVTFTEVSNESGLRIPAKALCAKIHEEFPDVHVHVDGAQSWGALHLDLRDMGCDSFSASAHKWFVGPKESGILYMKKSLVTDFWPNNFGYDAKIVLPEDLYDDARRFETLGQRNDPTLMGLLHTSQLLGLIGYDNIQTRIKYLVEKLRSGLLDMDLTLTTPADEALRHGVVVISFEDPDEGKKLYDYLYNEHKIGVSSTGGLRICPHIYNTEEHIDKVLLAIQEYYDTIPAAGRAKKRRIEK